MTDRVFKKRRRLALEILGLIAISAVIALLIFFVLETIAATVIEIYCFNNDIIMTEFDWLEADLWRLSASAIISIVFFSIIFLVLLGDRMAYIHKLTDGIVALRTGKQDGDIPIEGNNELTELADAINFLSATQKQIRQKEQTLANEKEQLIRTLSHDIRTPLTSILAYSEYLYTANGLSEEELKKHLQTIRKKAEQIHNLTDILLEGSKRSPEYFNDAHLLIEQLVSEFEESLEDTFVMQTDLTACGSFAGAFDVQELRRIFDNLSSNILKYADPQHPVLLTFSADDSNLVICQSNSVRKDPPKEDSYKLGINSIRRIAQYYSGQVAVHNDGYNFEIIITLSDF